MSHQVPEDASLELLIDYCSGARAAAMAADLPEVAASLGTFRTELKASRDARDAAREYTLETSAVVRVRDTNWDAVVTGVSGAAFLAAGKKPDQDPYQLLFGTVKADEATGLGPEKAYAFGDTLLTRARAQNHAAVVPLLPGVVAANDALKAAGDARAAASLAELPHEVERRKRVAALERVIAVAEVAILTKHPGRADLVRAVLAWPRAPKRKKTTQE
ncbi:MAG: hypothetical protein HY904_18635 [Deltaproteobacteria bacterium]|nr:hypothetical protein [Deltaproteobacteria bacterium]